MKKNIKRSLIALILVILVWGIVASCMTMSAYINSSKTVATYDKNGKYITTSEVPDGEEYLRIQKLDKELISSYENSVRYVKNRKIIMNKAKENYNKDKTDANKSLYEQARIDYEITKNSQKRTINSYVLASSTVFFGTYLPVIVLLCILLIINQKMDCKKKDQE